MEEALLVERFRRARRALDLAVLEGFHALKHALRFGAEVEVAAALDPERLKALAANLAPDLSGRFASLALAVTPEVFARLAPVAPETGVIAIARRPAVDPVRVLESEADAPVVLLDRPAHLGNVGAAVRVAAAGGAAGVLTTGRHDPWQPGALRGAAGLHFALPVTRIEALPGTGRPLIALHPDGEPLRTGAIPPRGILAFGTERGGLEPELLARAEHRLAIPMRPGVSSLNLATAVAIALYTWRLCQDENRS